jgi:hypothetical protein
MQKRDEFLGMYQNDSTERENAFVNDEAHLQMHWYVNKQNFHVIADTQPQILQERAL